MCAAMVDRNAEYPDYGRPMYDSQPQNDYGRQSYDYNRPTYDSYQQPADYNRSSYDAPRGQDYPPYQTSSDPPVKEEQASRRRDEMMHQQQVMPPQPTNQTEMYDHNQMSQQLREERRKEYNDYLDDHKQLDVKSVKSDRSLGSPSKQQKEQILNRAQHQLEIPVIDRRQANPDPPPPLHPPQDRPPSGRWDPQSYKQGSFGQVKRVTSPPHQANIGHDDYGAFRRQTELEVRRKDYNEFLAKKQQLEDDKRNKLAEQRRQAPAPIVKGDYYDSEQYDRRRQALNDLQHKEYQNYLKNKGFNQHQPPETNRRPELGMKSEFQDQEPAGRQSQRNYPVGSLIAGDRVDYPSSANEKFNKERRKEYNEYIKPQDLKNIHRKREEAIAKIESDGIDLDKVRIFPQGEYEQKHKELQEEWRKNFRDFAAKKHDVVKKDLEERERELARYYQKEIDNPAILPAGEYKERQKKLQKQWRDECRDYYSGHPVVQRSKDIWKEDEPVHTIPQSGEYKGRRQRLNAQLQKEFQHYQSQKTPPKERVKEFGPQGAVLFDPVYTKETKNRIREERSKDFKEFLEKQDTDRFRRQDNVRSDNRIGFMSQLGRPVEEMREKLAKERHEEYNKYLQDKYVSQSQHRPLERPKWVDPKLMEDNWQKEAAGSRSRPSSDKPVQTPTYEEMLERKRREEASYRRFDDPEYSRSGADRGYDAQYRRYNDPQ